MRNNENMPELWDIVKSSAWRKSYNCRYTGKNQNKLNQRS